jgi:glycosyltransferase involved in cell wall biosynthesis
MPSVGIGIVTYNRKDLLASTIESIRKFTVQPDALLVVADDGSTDGTLALLRERQIPVVTGVNMGIAWNKNRALFILAHELCCETVILLEDDSQPVVKGWERDWMDAAQRWGHINYGGDWMQEHFRSGTGTLADPYASKILTAQCAAYSRRALTYGGYFDPRFQGFGHEHVEHTSRLFRMGYFAGVQDGEGPHRQALFYMIRGGVAVRPSKSHYDAGQAEANGQVAKQLLATPDYRGPWRHDNDIRQFRAEIESALSGGLERFRLHRDPARGKAARPGFLARLFGRRRV